MKDYSISEMRKIGEAYQSVVEDEEFANAYPAYSDEQIANIVRRNAWGEGRSDGIEGMKDVIDAEFNRSNGNNANRVGVISAPKQFSAWKSMTPQEWNPQNFKINNHNELKGLDLKRWKEAEKIAADSLKPGYKPRHDYTYYVTKEQYDKEWDKNPDKWYYNKKPDEIRGSHCFFKNSTIENRDKFDPNFKRLTNADVGQKRLRPTGNSVQK